MAQVFTRRRRELDAKAKELLALALKASSEPAASGAPMYRSAMPATERDTIQNALNETFFLLRSGVQFETTCSTRSAASN